ncbi:hypothetical protein AB0P17_23360 [Streptomyces sp. NPDC088124]|uniref:hypothetical protein n=1 Tax=Streptomyces sp. NPDC088124 TaxID=3154654 RepID=UPI003435B282
MKLDKPGHEPGPEARTGAEATEGVKGVKGVESAGRLAMVVRIPVRVVVLVVVVPVRMVWDVLVAVARGLDRIVLRPLGGALSWLYASVLAPAAWGVAVAVGWLVTAVWQWTVVPVVRFGVVVPAVWSYRRLLTPLGHGIRWLYETLLTPLGHGLGVSLGWLGKALFVWPWAALWRYVAVPALTYGLARPAAWVYRRLLTPLGEGIARLSAVLLRGAAATGRALLAALMWLLLFLVVTPVIWVYRRILAPVGREIGAAFGVAWRVAGHLSRAAWRGLGWLAWQLVGRPASWTYRRICTPVGHWARDSVWVPARTAAAAVGRSVRRAFREAVETVRAARREAWRVLVGGVRVSRPVEPPEHRARTLGSTTIVPGAAPAPEISPHSVGRVRDSG